MKTKKLLLKIIIGIFLTFLIFGGATAFYVHRTVQEYVEIAQQSHPNPGDDIMALVQFMNSDSHSLQERNNIVWSIGRLGAPEALPFLEAIYTGELCDHDKYLCQYELGKAIRQCGGVVEHLQTNKH